jgi:hypothetical protein
VKITMKGAVSRKVLEANARHCRTLKLPRITQAPIHGKCVALVGGGPSIANHIDEIRAYDEVWGINEVPAYLKQFGIEATMFSIDPDLMRPECYDVKAAILAEYVSPEVFAALKGKDVRVFDGRYGGPTSMCRAPRIALNLGFARATIFGCEGSFSGQSHAYKEVNRGRIAVRCGGRDYLTQPDYFLQSEVLSEFVADHPQVFSERSGGLLSAMCRYRTWKIVGANMDEAA